MPLAVILSATSIWLAWGQARRAVVSTPPTIQTVDAIVTAARAAAALEPIAEKIIPLAEPAPSSPPGTYWLLQSETPPLPWCPFTGLEVIPLGGDHYLVDDRAVDWAGWQERAAEERLRAAVSEWAASSQWAAISQSQPPGGLMTLDNGVPSPPGAGEGGGTNEPPAWSPPVWPSSTQLCLIPPLFLSAGNVVLLFTNGVAGTPYDLYCTTNLGPTVAGLNLTNWLWLARSGPGQTNFIIVDPPWPEAYYVLGTTNDSDGGGFPDAYERLVTHGSVTNTGDDLLPVVRMVVRLTGLASKKSAVNSLSSMETIEKP